MLRHGFRRQHQFCLGIVNAFIDRLQEIALLCPAEAPSVTPASLSRMDSTLVTHTNLDGNDPKHGHQDEATCDEEQQVECVRIEITEHIQPRCERSGTGVLRPDAVDRKEQEERTCDITLRNRRLIRVKDGQWRGNRAFTRGGVRQKAA